MQNSIKFLPLIFAPFAFMSFSNRICDVASVNIVEEELGIRVGVDIDTHIIDTSNSFHVEVYIDNKTSKKMVGSYVHSYSAISRYHFENKNPFFYNLLKANSAVVVYCYPYSGGGEVEVITCPYVASKFATKNIVISEKDNNKTLSPKYLKTKYDINSEKKYLTYHDEITFKNYEDNIICPVYKTFDMRALRFTYKNGDDNILKGDFNFHLYDTYSLFSCFPLVGDTMYRQIPLSIYKENDEYSFCFKEKLYYNPTTFQTVLSPKEGYYETPYLYMPKGHFNKFNTIKCRLVMDVSSFYSYNITGEFHILFLKNYVGDCFDSEYCVNVAIDYGENTRGKTIEVIL